MVLGTHVHLSAFAGGTGAGVDVFSGVVGSDERYGTDVGVIADVIDGLFSSVDDVDNTIWDTALLEQVDDELTGVRNTLGRLADEGVSGGDGQGVHPERYHGGEVVGGNTSTDSKGSSVGLNVNTGSDILESLSLHE